MDKKVLQYYRSSIAVFSSRLLSFHAFEYDEVFIDGIVYQKMVDFFPEIKVRSDMLFYEITLAKSDKRRATEFFKTHGIDYAEGAIYDEDSVKVKGEDVATVSFIVVIKNPNDEETEERDGIVMQMINAYINYEKAKKEYERLFY